MATYNIDNLPSNYSPGDIINCPYSGSVKSLTLPKGEYRLECWGAKGSGDTGYMSNGGYSVGTYNASNSITLYCDVGGAGGGLGGAGGHNGGGRGTSYSYDGGGATHIATQTGLLVTLSSAQNSVLIVAGGGGGGRRNGGNPATGGLGGGSTGGEGGGDDTYRGKGATMTAGGAGYSSDLNGSFGLGGPAGNGASRSDTYSGAGGGGWYGGGGGQTSSWWFGGYSGSGGGGSGYIADSSHAVGTVYLTNASTTQQVTSTTPDSSNNGYIRITVISTSNAIYSKINNTWHKYTSAYKKVNGVWVLQQELSSNLIDQSKLLKYGGNI